MPLGCNPIDYNFLTPICEEIIDPWQDGVVDAIIPQDVYEATVGDRIESLHKVTVYDIDAPTSVQDLSPAVYNLKKLQHGGSPCQEAKLLPTNQTILPHISDDGVSYKWF